MDKVVLDPESPARADGPVKSFFPVVGALQRLGAWARRKELVIVTDGASWDARAALAYLVLSPRWRVIGVVSTAQNDVVSSCLAALPLKRAPEVFAGSDVPLRSATELSEGARLIIDASANHTSRNRLMVVVLGAATDVAQAVDHSQRVAERIEIVAAAFNRWPDGGDAAAAKLDMGAWQLIMDADVPVTLASRAVARRRLRLQPAQALHRLRARSRDVTGNKIVDWLQSGGKGDAAVPTASELPGLLAVAHVLGHAKTVMYARPTITDEGTFLHGGSIAPLPCQTCVGEPRIRWISDVDELRFWGELVALVAGYENKKATRRRGD